MSTTLTGKAPLGVPSGAEVVASSRGWHLAVTHHEPDNRSVPKYRLLDRRGCLDLLLAVKRAWWRIAFRRAMRGASPGARLEGLYVSSGLVEVARDFLGDHVRVLGVKLRTERVVLAFRRGLVASMLLGRRLSAELARNGPRLAWPAPEPRPLRPHPPPGRAAPPRRRPACLIPEPAWARPLAPPRHAVLPAPALGVRLLTAAGSDRQPPGEPELADEVLGADPGGHDRGGGALGRQRGPQAPEARRPLPCPSG